MKDSSGYKEKSMAQSAIQLNQVHISFTEDAPLLRGITFNVNAGEKVSILGPGGSGKSTILKIILGLMQPDQGNAFLDGVEMANASEEERQQVLKRVGMAFQQGALFDYMTVFENIEFAMQNSINSSTEQKHQKILELLQGVKLGRTAQLFPYELSGGMQRRVGIARAMANDPKIAIFDEPTSGLDPVTSTIILNMILALAGSASDNTLVVATSSVDIAMRFSDRLIVINEGVVVADGSWKKLLLESSDWVRNFLSVRLIGLDLEYVRELGIPEVFIQKHWKEAGINHTYP